MTTGQDFFNFFAIAAGVYSQAVSWGEMSQKIVAQFEHIYTKAKKVSYTSIGGRKTTTTVSQAETPYDYSTHAYMLQAAVFTLLTLQVIGGWFYFRNNTGDEKFFLPAAVLFVIHTFAFKAIAIFDLHRQAFLSAMIVFIWVATAIVDTVLFSLEASWYAFGFFTSYWVIIFVLFIVRGICKCSCWEVVQTETV
jgi:hypothetical protein